jgi:hypothetical protein
MSHKVVFMTAFAIAATSASAHGDIELEVSSTANRYAFGECIVIKTLLKTRGDTEEVPNEVINIGPTFQFAFAKDGGPFLKMYETQHYITAKPPIQFEGFTDEQAITSRSLSSQGAIQRTDLLLMGESGTYQVKAVLKTANGETFESNTIAATVEPFDADTALARLVGQDPEKVLDAGRFVFMAYYAPGVMMDPDTFGMPPEDFVAELRAADPQSPHLEGLDAALASLSLIGESGILMSYGLSSDSYMDLCSDFVKRYPDSPYTQALIFRLYWNEYYNKQDGRPDWALALGKKVLESPIKHASVASGRIPNE